VDAVPKARPEYSEGHAQKKKPPNPHGGVRGSEFRVWSSEFVILLSLFFVLCSLFFALYSLHFNIHSMVVIAKGLLWLFVGKTKKRKKSDVN